MTSAASAARSGLRFPRGVALLAPGLLLVLVLYALPIARLIALSFGEGELTAQAYADLFGPWEYGSILLRTVLLSACIALGCLLLGYPIAHVLANSPRRRRALIALLVLLPFWTSVLVRNFAWSYLLRSDGWVSRALGFFTGTEPVGILYNEIGVVIGMVNTLLPFMVLPIAVSLLSHDRSLRDAAASLGASPAKVFLEVTLPLSRPGIFTGAIIVFCIAMGFFITPALLGGGRVTMAATFINHQVEDLVDWPLAAAASVVLLALIVGLLAAAVRAGGISAPGASDARR